MKKLLLSILVVLMLSGFAFAEPAPVSCPNVFRGTLAANTSTYNDTTGVTSIVPLKMGKNEGFFSVQAVYTGTGVLKIDYRVSNDGVNWGPAVEIIASATNKTPYPFPADGVSIFGGYILIVLTETGTANPVVFTGTTNGLANGVKRCVQ